MSKKNSINYAELSLEDLSFELQNAESQYRQLRFEHTTTGLENPNNLVIARRSIAKIKTEIRSRELSKMSKEELTLRSKIRARRRKE